MGEMISHTIEGQAFLGAMAEKESAKKVEWVADKMINVVHFRPDSDEDRKKASDYSSRIINGMGFEADTVENLISVEEDDSRTARQKEIAKENLEVLAKGTFLAMQKSMDIEAMDLLGQGSAVEIDNFLPEPLKGLGEKIVKNVISNEVILGKLRDLDDVRENCDLNNLADKKIMLDEMSQSYTDLTKMRGLSPNEKDQLYMVKAYLNTKMQTLKGDAKVEERRGGDSEASMEIPSDKEGQLVMVRKLLEKVESSQRTTRDIYQGQFSARLEEIIAMEGIKSEVAIEVRSRLKLHDCSVLMKKSNGYIEAPRSGGDPECPTVGMAATLAEGLNHALDNESLNFFLKSGANGFPVAEAWDYYQDVNIKYREILKKIEKRSGELTRDMKIVIDNDADLGSIDANYFTDGNTNRKKRVDEYVLDELMKKNNKLDRATAEKAWNMAKKLALATGENSIFNPALTGNDEMAEDIYLKIYRKERDEKGRPRGPQIHVDKIVGIGNSFLRRVSKVDPTDNNGIIPLYSKDVIIEPKNKLGVEEGAYVYHFSVFWSAKIHPLRGLLLKRDPDPREIIGIDSLQTAQDYFAKADPDGKKNLKYWWVMGVLDLACSYGSLGWSQDDISKFRQFLIKTNLSEKAGTFLSISEWDKVMKEGGFVKKMLKLDLKRIGQSFFDSNSGGRRK